MLRPLIFTGVLLLLGSCSASEQSRTLEERAKAGDPTSACQLVVEDLQACPTARQKWMAHPNVPQRQCQKDAISGEHHAYLVSAVNSLAGDARRGKTGKLALEAADLMEMSLRIDSSIPGTSLFDQQFGPLMSSLGESCLTLGR
jgi:hypothetical protein